MILKMAKGAAASSATPFFSKRGILPRPIHARYMLGIVPV